jgi:pSer/pThr/pTyr-binding forkhead associated (FHA) protein
MPSLKLWLKNKPIRDFQLQQGVTITIGRREDNDVAVEGPAVSGHHAKIDSLGERFVLTDLQSTNGSFVNEQLVNSHWLKDGDVISIGDYSLVFEHHQQKSDHKKTSDQYDDTLVMNSTRHRQMMKKSTSHKSINVVKFWDMGQSRGRVKEADPQPSRPAPRHIEKEPGGTLAYLAGGSGQIELTRKITTIGKHPTSDIVVKGLLQNPTSATISKTAQAQNQ